MLNFWVNTISFKTIYRGIKDTENMRHANTLQFTGVLPKSHKQMANLFDLI